MSEKKETLNLFLAMLISIGLIFAGLWFLMERWAQLTRNQVSTSSSPHPSESEKPTNSWMIQNESVTKCNLANLPGGTFNYGGSTTWAPIRRDVDQVLERTCPQFILRYTQPTNKKPGSGTGIEMLIDNQLAFSQSSRSLKGED